MGDTRLDNPKKDPVLTEVEMQQTLPGPGSGSKIPFADAPAFGGLYAYGDHAIKTRGEKPFELMPSFIVLGHEIGHAIRQQAGESTLRIKSPFHETEEGVTWENTEEQSVITGTENRLRREHNLGERKFHEAFPLPAEAVTR